MKPELACPCGARIRIQNTKESRDESKYWRSRHKGHTVADRRYVFRP